MEKENDTRYKEKQTLETTIDLTNDVFSFESTTGRQGQRYTETQVRTIWQHRVRIAVAESTYGGVSIPRASIAYSSKKL